MPLQILPKINCRSLAKEISRFLKNEFAKRGKRLAVVAVSGGVDSSLAAKLCKMAGLETKKVFLPYLPALPAGQAGGRHGGKNLQKPDGYSFEINIGSIVDEQIKKIGKYAILDKIDKGNIMARTRMIIQYALARKLGGLVVGTENLSEYYLGYFTMHGDQACDIRPIAGLWKTQVIELAGHLGLAIPEPTAGLWKGQTDQNELGFSYAEADPILYLYCVKKINPAKIIKDFDLNRGLVYRVVKRANDTEYKRKEAPLYEPK